MATPQQFANKLREAIRLLNANRARELQTVAADGLALVVSRVQNKGKKASGAKFPPYSTTPVPSFWLAHRALNAAGRAKIAKQRRASYKDLRKASGLPVNITNLTFTGGMWRGTGVEPRRESSTAATVAITGLNPRARRLIFYNSIRYGNILTFSNREAETVADAYAERQVNTILRALR